MGTRARPKRNRGALGGSKSGRATRLKGLIAKLDYLIAHSTGLKHFSYKIRRHQAKVALKGVKRSMRPKARKSSRTQYIVNSKGVQGGAPGLVQQKS